MSEAVVSGDQTQLEGAPLASNRGARLQAALALIQTVALSLLLLLYLAVGDTKSWGEYLTIWPPLLWLLPNVLLAIPLMWRRHWRANLPLGGALLLFFLLLIEWRPMLRWGAPKKSPSGIRIVTWNIGGGYESEQALLTEMEKWSPDIVLLQETPDSRDSFSRLSGYWAGWHWTDSGDAGTLSRWPVRVLASESVGPWDEPQILSVETPSGPILIANMRLMLPSLELFPFSATRWNRLSADNRERIAQYPAITDLITRRSAEGKYIGAIVGGDFNTDASAQSLTPLRDSMIDVWKSSGRGWGGTATRDFPVARIDHLFISHKLLAVDAWIPKSPMSDHRPLVADIQIAAQE